MKGNQGLEALAALCGGQADAMNDSARNASAPVASAVAAPEILPSNLVANAPSAASAYAERLGAAAAQPSQAPLSHVSAQQWSQALVAAATLRSGGIDPAMAAQTLILSALQQQQQQQPHQMASAVGSTDSAFAAAMQQLALQHYVQAQAKLSMQQASHHAAAVAAQQEQQAAAAAVQQANTTQQQQHAALMIALAAGNGQHLHNGGAPELTNPSHQKVIPPAVARPSIAHSVPVAPNNGHLHPHIPSSNSAATFTKGNMRPPASPAALSSSQTSSVGVSDDVASVQNQSVAGAGGRILPHLEAALPSSASSVASSSFSSGGYGGDGKKQMKRAANRKSAQLSRKRKKVFMEELKEENDELRRKEQILRAIPDLIVVFDSSGKLGFVSESVSRFFDIAQEDLEGTSFWDRLCDDSVRLLKAAFMDSLAARKLDSDTAPLGSGVWELRLVDKKSNYMIVTLNGVVHFTGEAPECVCCIRPREEPLVQTVSGNSGAALNKDGVISSNSSTSKQGHVKAGSKRTVSSDDYSQGSDSSSGVIPSQSVMVRSGLSADDHVSAEQRKQLGRHMGGVPGEGLHRSGQVVRISDGDSVEAVSESCSDDGVASN